MSILKAFLNLKNSLSTLSAELQNTALLKIKEHLKQLYGQDSVLYKGPNDVETSEHQLTQLLNTYSKFRPEIKFKNYQKQLSNPALKKSLLDSEIIFRHTKQLFESALLVMQDKNKEINAQAINASFMDSPQETYFKLAKALGMYQGDHFPYFLANTKKEILYKITLSYLKSANLVSLYPSLNKDDVAYTFKDDIKYKLKEDLVITLINFVAKDFGLEPFESTANISLEKEILEDFAQHVKAQFTEAKLVEAISNKAPALPDTIANIESGHPNTILFKNFFKLFDEEITDSAKKYLILYEEDKKNPSRLRLKSNHSLLRNYFIATQLQEKGYITNYMSGDTYEIGSHTIVFNGEKVFLKDTNNHYVLATFTDIILLIQEATLAGDDLQNRLFKQLNTEELYFIYSNEIRLGASLNNLKALLQKPDLPQWITDGICDKLAKGIHNHSERKAFLAYILKNKLKVLPDSTLKLVSAFTEQERLNYLELAIKTNSSALVELLLKSTFGFSTIKKLYPMHLAAQHNADEVIKTLTKRGFEINSFDANNYTPAMYAVQNKKTKALSALIKLGKPNDLAKENENGVSAASLAVAGNYGNTLRTFVKTHNGVKVLVLAAVEHNHLEVLEKLHKIGVNLESYIPTLLMLGLRKGNEQMIIANLKNLYPHISYQEILSNHKNSDSFMLLNSNSNSIIPYDLKPLDNIIKASQKNFSSSFFHRVFSKLGNGALSLIAFGLALGTLDSVIEFENAFDDFAKGNFLDEEKWSRNYLRDALCSPNYIYGFFRPKNQNRRDFSNKSSAHDGNVQVTDPNVKSVTRRENDGLPIAPVTENHGEVHSETTETTETIKSTIGM